MTLSTVYADLRKAIGEAGSQTAWARQHDISLGHVNDVLNARVTPSPRILFALNIRRVVTYERITE